MISLDLDVDIKTLQIMLLGWDYDIDEIENMSMEQLFNKVKQILEVYCEKESLRQQEQIFMSNDRKTVDKYIDFLKRKRDDC